MAAEPVPGSIGPRARQGAAVPGLGRRQTQVHHNTRLVVVVVVVSISCDSR